MNRGTGWLVVLLMVGVMACQLGRATPPLPGSVGRPTSMPATLTRTPTNTPKIPTSTATRSHSPTPSQTPYPSQTPPPTQVEAFSTPLALTGTPAPQSRIPLSPENVSEVVELIRFGDGRVNDVTYSPDGSQIAVATSLGVQLYSAATLTVVSELETAQPVQRVLFAPDGERLALAFADFVLMWWPGSGALERVFEGAVTDMVFRPDAALVMIARAPGSSRSYLRIWQDGRLQNGLAVRHPVALLPGGETVLTGNYTEGLDILQISDGALFGELEQAECPHNSVYAFSPDGRYIASTGCMFAELLMVWRVEDGALLWTIDSGYPIISSIEFSPDSTQVAGITYAGTLRMWDAYDGTLVTTLGAGSRGGRDRYNGTLSFSPDGNTLLVGYQYGEVLAWRWRDGVLVKRLKDPVPDGSYALLSPDGQTAAMRSWSKVQIWNIHSGALLHTLEVPREPAGSYGQARMASIRSAPDLLSGPSGDIRDIVYSPDGRFLAAQNDAVGLVVWRTSDWEPVLHMTWSWYYVEMAFSPDGAVFTIIDRGALVVWETDDWSAATEITLPEESSEIWFLPDGKTFFALAPDDSTVVLHQIRRDDGQVIANYEFVTFNSDIVFSPDGSLIVLPSSMQVIDFATGESGRIFEGEFYTHEGGYIPRHMSVVRFSPDMRLMAFTSDGYLQVLNTSNWHTAALLQLHNNLAGRQSIAFSADGTRLLSAGADGTARLWGVLP